MPNYCENDLTITGDKIGEVLAFIASPGDAEKAQRVFDFDKVIPYPDKYKMLDAKAEEFGKEMMAVNSDDPEMAGRQREQICEKYGVGIGEFFKDGYNSGGYEWCVKNWGTKWNAVRVQIVEQTEVEIKLTFDTAWSPPIPVIEKLGEKFPSCHFTLEFFECGMGFQGVLEMEDGQPSISYDEYSGDRGG